MTAPPQKPPSGLKQAGRALWTAVVDRLVLDHREAVLLTEACRIKDRLDRLETLISKGTALDLVLLTEARHQQITLTRVLASLRLPDDLTNPQQRPQRRGAARGTYRQREVT